MTNLFLLVAVVIGGLVLFAATRPDTFRVERHIVINRPASEIFPLLDNFHNWPHWSPWEDLDPALRRTFRGSPSGVGAVYEWEGNAKVGKGHMEITRVDRPTHITIDLWFVRPFKANNAAAFDLEPEAGGTEVSWAIYGPLPFASKLMGVFVSMDRLMGKDFERGLAKLKEVAEQRTVQPV